jgi:CRISPR/Cas system CSM-associated protein Csm2 small subunit
MKDQQISGLFKTQLRDIYDYHRYRESEIFVFYFQIIAMIIYVIYCMIFKALKKLR